MSRSLNIKTCNAIIVWRSSCRSCWCFVRAEGESLSLWPMKWIFTWVICICSDHTYLFSYWHTRHMRTTNGSKWKLNQLNRGRALVAADINDIVVSRNKRHTMYWLSLHWHCLAYFSTIRIIQWSSNQANEMASERQKRERKRENNIGIEKKQKERGKSNKKEISKATSLKWHIIMIFTHTRRNRNIQIRISYRE